MIFYEDQLITSIPLGPSSTNGGAGGVWNSGTFSKFTWAKQLTFEVTIEAVNGSPTGGGLTGKFQMGALRAVNNIGPNATVNLFNLDQNQIVNLIDEAEDWGTLASFNTSLSSPITVRRTIRNFGEIVNLRLDASTLSGGTNPTFTVSVKIIAKG